MDKPRTMEDLIRKKITGKIKKPTVNESISSLEEQLFEAEKSGNGIKQRAIRSMIKKLKSLK